MIGNKNWKKKGMEEIKSEEPVYSAGHLQFKKELPELNLIPQCVITEQSKTNIMKFKVLYTPESDSIWYGGKYEFSIEVLDEYPFKAPKVMCLTKIYHPNIDFSGNVCLNILKDDWSPILNVSTVIAGLYYLFTDPNAKDPLNHEAATVMRDNPDLFYANVKKSLKGGSVFGQDFPKFI